jgi:hypothetical protein
VALVRVSFLMEFFGFFGLSEGVWCLDTREIEGNEDDMDRQHRGY